MHNIIYGFLTKYGIQGGNIPIYTFITAAALTVSGYYAFPVNKDDRDINELILSPIIIVVNIGISYIISTENILKSLENGNSHIASSLLLFFIIATFIQVVNYLKKLFEKLHDLPKYKRRIHLNACLAKQIISFISGYISKNISQYKELIVVFKNSNNKRYFYLEFLLFIIIVIGGWLVINQLVWVILPSLNINQATKMLLENIAKYLIMSYFIFFSIVKSYNLFISLIKEKKFVTKRIKWKITGYSMVGLGLLLGFFVSLFSIKLNSITYIFTSFMIIGMVLLKVTDFVKWLFEEFNNNKEL